MVVGIISGVISGLISSAIFFTLMYKIKPKISLSEKMCKEQMSGEKDKNYTLLTVKVVNLSRSLLMNVHYSMFLKRTYEDKVSDIKEIKPVKSELKAISGYSKKDDDAAYAIVLSYKIETKLLEEKGNSKILFMLYGSHSFSNTTSYVQREYELNDIVEGVFETEKSTKVIINKK